MDPKNRRRKFRISRPPPPKTTLAAALMLVGGLVLLTLGSVISVYEDGKRGGALILTGLLVFIPGSYSTSIIYGAYRSWPGYNYDQVPSYD